MSCSANMKVMLCNLANFMSALTVIMGARLVSVSYVNRKVGIFWSPIHE